MTWSLSTSAAPSAAIMPSTKPHAIANFRQPIMSIPRQSPARKGLSLNTLIAMVHAIIPHRRPDGL
jgi:hypothetical protein